MPVLMKQSEAEVSLVQANIETNGVGKTVVKHPLEELDLTCIHVGMGDEREVIVPLGKDSKFTLTGLNVLLQTVQPSLPKGVEAAIGVTLAIVSGSGDVVYYKFSNGITPIAKADLKRGGNSDPA